MAPVVIFLALALIVASAILLRNSRNREEDAYQRAELKVLLRENEHLLGVATAPVKIVEYAEAECVYCKRLHPVLLRVVDENDGNVALVYRHFPLSIHPKSFNEAIALECAAEAGGNSFFWSYLETLYEATPSNNKIDLAIVEHAKKKHGLAIGERTAELIKIAIGNALKQVNEEKINVRGRDLTSGYPKTIELTSNEITDAMQ